MNKIAAITAICGILFSGPVGLPSIQAVGFYLDNYLWHLFITFSPSLSTTCVLWFARYPTLQKGHLGHILRLRGWPFIFGHGLIKGIGLLMGECDFQSGMRCCPSRNAFKTPVWLFRHVTTFCLIRNLPLLSSISSLFELSMAHRSYVRTVDH